MLTGKVFECGGSQALRIPRDYRFKDKEVYMNKISDVVMLIPKNNKWSGFIKGLELFSNDFKLDEKRNS